MLKIILVDDEDIVIQGLSMVINESCLNCQIVGSASNGVEGLKTIEEIVPDIVITDIKMPDMDGLEMVKKLLATYPDTLIVIYSGFAEFDYAQIAVELGVFKYLLKPINPEDIIDALKEASEYIENRERIKEEQKRIKEQLDESIPIIKEKLLNDLMHDIISPRDYDMYNLEFLNLVFKYLAVLSIRVDTPENIELDQTSKDKYYNLFALRNTGSKLCSKFFNDFHIINNFDDTICIIVNAADCDRKKLLEFAEHMKNTVNDVLNLSVSIGIGRYYDHIKYLYLSYNESQTALNCSLINNGNFIQHINEVSPVERSVICSFARAKEIASYIKSCDTEKMNDSLRDLLIDAGADNVECLKRAAFEMYMTVSQSLYEMGINLVGVEIELDIYTEIVKCHSGTEIIILLEKYFRQFIENIERNKKSYKRKIVDQVIQTIEKSNYKNVSLKGIADQIYLNSSYLSELFRQETGETFTEYLKKSRIEKAKELMSNLDLKIYQISEMVGYADSRHFSQIFKQLTGMSPSDYRNS